jgi:hypothetical protein
MCYYICISCKIYGMDRRAGSSRARHECARSVQVQAHNARRGDPLLSMLLTVIPPDEAVPILVLQLPIDVLLWCDKRRIHFLL